MSSIISAHSLTWLGFELCRVVATRASWDNTLGFYLSLRYSSAIPGFSLYFCYCMVNCLPKVYESENLPKVIKTIQHIIGTHNCRSSAALGGRYFRTGFPCAQNRASGLLKMETPWSTVSNLAGCLRCMRKKRYQQYCWLFVGKTAPSPPLPAETRFHRFKLNLVDGKCV